jgi:CDK inhibitor PHO81
MAVPASSQPSKSSSSLSSAIIGSAATSPSNHSGMSPGGHATTVSSMTGNYVHAVVQLTRDGHPVVFSGIRLPEEAFDLSVSDVTLAQFEAAARKRGRWVESFPSGWNAVLHNNMTALDILLKVHFHSMAILKANCSTRCYPLNLGSA